MLALYLELFSGVCCEWKQLITYLGTSVMTLGVSNQCKITFVLLIQWSENSNIRLSHSEGRSSLSLDTVL